MWYNLVISLPMLVCFFWLTFFLIRCFRSEPEPRVTWLLTGFFAVAATLYMNHWLYFSGHPSTIGEWIYSVANLCVYPLYFAYLCALTRGKTNRLELLVLFLPALVVAVLFPVGLRLFARISFAVQVIWVLVRGYRLLWQTIRRMDNTYSDDRSRLLMPTHVLLILFAVTSFVSIVLNVLGRDYFTHQTFVLLPAGLMTLLLYGLGYVAAHTVMPRETVVMEEEREVDYPATTEETDELMFRIAAALREQKLYADANLTIQDVAAAVNSNRTYVSKCINRRTGLSFSQYIARYRVEHAQTILCDKRYTSDHDAIAAAIALSGFTSDQTFYRVFKEITGTTPLQYRQQNKQK